MPEIHATAFVDPAAELAPDVSVGAFSYVGPQVTLGPGCLLHNHVTITGATTIGAENVFFPQCVLGADPQDLKYRGGHTELVIGDRNTFRELVTVHRGTEIDAQSGGTTRIGDCNLLMVGVHVAHDACVHNHTIIANNVLLAGHVQIEDCVNIGGAAALHHFVTAGRYAFIGGMTRVTSDVPPYMKVSGFDAAVRGFNGEGLRRWRVEEASIAALKAAYRLMYARRGEQGAGRITRALELLEARGLGTDVHVRYLIDFVRRQQHEGVFGRAREQGRRDSQHDRDRFYQQKHSSGVEINE